MNRRQFLKSAAAIPVLQIGCSHVSNNVYKTRGHQPARSPRPAWRSGLAFRSELGQAEPGSRRTTDQGGVAIGCMSGRANQRSV